MIILRRQARDKHRENSNKRCDFYQGFGLLSANRDVVRDDSESGSRLRCANRIPTHDGSLNSIRLCKLPLIDVSYKSML